MPTGYTAGVGDGSVTTLRQFALVCARGMGATIMMRDEPLGAPIPERFEPDTKWYDERIDAARSALAEAASLTAPEECSSRADAAYADEMRSHLAYKAGRDQENQRYRAMIAEVTAWETDAEGIKEFMLQQLGVSIDDYSPEPPKKLSGLEWRAQAIEKAARDLAYYTEERAKEIARTAGRNKWLSDLRASLPAEPSHD